MATNQNGIANTANSKFGGLLYPLEPGNPTGTFSPSYGNLSVRTNLLSILLTNKSERVMENTFGAGLSDLLFELNGMGIEQTARDRIVEQIALYEPRITVQDLLVTTTPPADNLLAPGDTGDNVLYIRINYVSPDNITQVEQLTLELPLGGNSSIGEI